MTINYARRTAVRTGVAWCAVGRLAGAQLPGVAVDPHLVVLTPARPAGEVTVFNTRPTPAEFTVDLRFGYVTTDSVGTPRVELSTGRSTSSAADWITPYPRRFSLLPGMSQVVRLLARPPANILDGEYWARLTVHSHDLIATADGSAERHDARVGISLETATVLPVFFRKGQVTTGVSIDDIHATADGDSIDVRMALHRTGNAAFIGVAQVVLLGPAGKEIGGTQRQLAVYLSARTRLRIPLPAAESASRNTIAVTLSTRRHDVPSRLVLQAEPLRRETAVMPP